jgi:hypothetical protein
MTDLHKLTLNIPQSQSALILPNFTTTLKYTYIYETKECIERKDRYYLVDRFYCFVSDGLAT